MKCMKSNERFSLPLVVAGLICVSMIGLAQAAQNFKARLSVVPVANFAARNNIDESPTVPATANATATLAGRKLTVTGTFEGFKAPASIAQIRSGPAMGVRGPVLFDLTVTKATKGTFSGIFDLTQAQVDLLRANRLYIQIHNQNTPDGALWGWLLK